MNPVGSALMQQITTELLICTGIVSGTWNGVVTKWTNPLPSWSLRSSKRQLRDERSTRTMLKKNYDEEPYPSWQVPPPPGKGMFLLTCEGWGGTDEQASVVGGGDIRRMLHLKLPNVVKLPRFACIVRWRVTYIFLFLTRIQIFAQ